MSYKSLYKLFVMNDSSTFNKIYENKYNSPSTIKFDFLINNNQAFFTYDVDILTLISRIREIDFELKNIINKLPDVSINSYLQKSLIEEIENTNEIEGVKFSKNQFLSITYELKSMNKIKNIFDGIVYKYLNLAENDLKLENSYDIRKLYDEMLYEEILEEDSNNLPDGNLFRKEAVHVYKSTNKIVHNGILPETKIIEYIDKSLDILNNASIDILVRISLFHYLFGFIHPFYDGNGRINRFISSYYLTRYFNDVMGYRLSLAVNKNLTKYLNAFDETNDLRNKADLSTFVFEFLDIIYDSYLVTKQELIEKQEMLNKYETYCDHFISLNNYNNNIQIDQLLKILIQNTIFANLGLTKKEICQKLNYGNTMTTEFLGILKKHNLIIDTNIHKHHYYQLNLENLKSYVEKHKN